MKGEMIVLMYLLTGSFVIFTSAAVDALMKQVWIFPIVWMFLLPVYVWAALGVWRARK